VRHEGSVKCEGWSVKGGMGNVEGEVRKWKSNAVSVLTRSNFAI
jgi:hypothetical protein